MKRAIPYLMFPGNAEEAFALYRTVFGGDTGHVLRYRDLGTTGPDEDLVAHVALTVDGEILLMGSDTAGASRAEYRVGTNVEIHLTADDADEARRLFGALAEGGTISMPIERVAWSELFGSCVDRYGVRWIVDYQGDVQFGMP
jgi:PhnB protein